ncbi:MAG: M23 family metallopeptidase [Rhodoglobus sp.]
MRLAAIGAALALLVTLGVAGSAPSWADDYATWDQVNAARNDVAQAEALIRKIEAQLAALQAEAARTQADAEAKGTIWQQAEEKFQAAAARAATLQQQADAANATASASEQRAGQMAAQLVRVGGGDISANLLVSGDADNLLYGLGMSSKISEQANAIYERAILDRNTAQALTDQAEVAKAELQVLRDAAEKAFAEAQTAAIAAQAALEEQLNRQAELQAQLVVLREQRAATEADYLAGVRERIAAAASLDAGEISASGWVRPAAGYITSSFGWRTDPWYSYHSGTDIGAGCGANIYAASGGTVIYAGWNGGYGNYILIDHGNGVRTAYGHIVGGGYLVSYGQRVEVAQNIAKVGTTGNSTGCHLHFETIVNGVAVNPVNYMAGQGIRIG